MIDPNSAAIVAKAILPYRGAANLSNSEWWGINVAYADRNSTEYEIGCTMYWCDRPVTHRIPDYARPTRGSDAHLLTIDAHAKTELDMWLADRTGASWNAGTRATMATDGPAVGCPPGERCPSANAAGFALGAGILRPEEIRQGHIDHALVITTPYIRSTVHKCPATSTDGRYDDANAISMGAQLQLDPALAVDDLMLPEWKKTVLRALQEYGAYVVDTGGSLSIRAESTALRGYDAWARIGMSSEDPNLADLPWDRMRVLASADC